MHQLSAADPVDPFEDFWADGPLLRANMVTSVDGAAMIDGRVGELTGPADQQLLKVLRAVSDVVLVGAGTVRAEGYGPVTVPDPSWSQRRRDRGMTAQPGLAVVSRSLELDPAASMFTRAEVRTVVLTCAAAPAERRDRLAEVADVVVVGDDTVDVAQGLARLRERGARHVLTEGGPRLLSQLFDLDLVDELFLALAPLLAGVSEGRILDGETPSVRRALRLVSVATAEDYLFCRYQRSGLVASN